MISVCLPILIIRGPDHPQAMPPPAAAAWICLIDQNLVLIDISRLDRAAATLLVGLGLSGLAGKSFCFPGTHLA
jgi:hypothetical protein